jgi:phytoene dehydrogenase-like protein
LAPAGKHVVNLFGGHAPYKLAKSDWNVEKEKFRKNALDVVDRFAPGFSEEIVGGQFLVAPDIENIVHLPQGHIFQGELSADQLFFQRPVPHYADYRSPIKGLYLCGASTHPGGGVSGINGYNAAREILKDRGIASGMRYG